MMSACKECRRRKSSLHLLVRHHGVRLCCKAAAAGVRDGDVVVRVAPVLWQQGGRAGREDVRRASGRRADGERRRAAASTKLVLPLACAPRTCSPGLTM